MLRARSSLGGLVAVAVLLVGAAVPAVATESRRVALGVAEFERVPPASPDVPDVGALLADRLSTLGVERVVGPARLGASSSAEPTDDEVRGVAARSKLGGVVVGRTTRTGTSPATTDGLMIGSQ